MLLKAGETPEKGSNSWKDSHLKNITLSFYNQKEMEEDVEKRYLHTAAIQQSFSSPLSSVLSCSGSQHSSK